MVKTILITVSVLFIVIGICEFIYIIKMFFCYPTVPTKNYSLIFLKKDYSLEQLNYIYHKIRWHGDDYANGIVGLTDMLEQSEIELCNRFIKNKKIYLFNSNDFLESEYIKEGLFYENH